MSDHDPASTGSCQDHPASSIEGLEPILVGGMALVGDAEDIAFLEARRAKRR